MSHIRQLVFRDCEFPSGRPGPNSSLRAAFPNAEFSFEDCEFGPRRQPTRQPAQPPNPRPPTLVTQICAYCREDGHQDRLRRCTGCLYVYPGVSNFALQETLLSEFQQLCQILFPRMPTERMAGTQEGVSPVQETSRKPDSCAAANRWW